MAKADYICCDKCGSKIIYDADDRIFDALEVFHVHEHLCPNCSGKQPALCKENQFAQEIRYRFPATPTPKNGIERSSGSENHS